MAELKRVTKDELIINLLAMYYHCPVADVIRIAEEEKKQKELVKKEESNHRPPM